MRPSHLVKLILSAVLTLTSLAATITPTLAQPPAVRDTTAQILKRLGGKPCPDSDFTCVTLQMPLDHFDAKNPRKISVVFAVLPATGKRKGMFVTATGGPGTSGLAAKDSYTAAFDPNIRKSFDIVFFDQRGVAASGGLACPNAAATYYQTDQRANTPAQESAVKKSARTFANSCVNEMNASGILQYLGTNQAVEDLEAFRQLMQDDKFWLYGESYGTQYAQTYAAAHTANLAGLILDGTVDLTLTGTGFLAQQAQAFNDTLMATLSACNNDESCAADSGGDAQAAFDKLEKQLADKPIHYNYPLPSGKSSPRDFAFADLETVAVDQLYSEGDRMILQRALAAGQSGDVVPLARLLYLALGVDPGTYAVSADSSYSDAMYYSVECQDYGYFSGSSDTRANQYMRAGDPVDASVPHLGGIFYGDLPCVYWPKASQDATRPAPLVAQGVPTLVLGALADPATPNGNGVNVYHNLANGYLVTETGGPHVIFGWGNSCVDDLVTAYLVKDQMPAQRETTCDGVVADDYVPLSPTDASQFDKPLDAFQAADTEIYYLPEFYYWDGATDTTVGCPLGGTLAFTVGNTDTQFTLNQCAFAKGWAMTGAGTYNSDKDRTTLNVKVNKTDYKYVRQGDNAKVTPNK